MKVGLAVVFLGAILFAYAFSIPPYTDEVAFMAQYMKLSAGQSSEYWALRDSMLTARFKLQDYGVTLIALGVAIAYFKRRGLRAPSSRAAFVTLALFAPFLAVTGYVGDLFLGFARGEFPHWADSLGIPLMGAPVMLVLLVVWAGLHLLFLVGGFRRRSPLREALTVGRNYWLLAVAAITAALMVWTGVLGQYYYAIPAALWLYLYLALGAGSARLAANNSLKPTPLRSAA
ncbi:MAG TPA: hypothetical protein VIT66_00490 [Lysobacter sp.]